MARYIDSDKLICQVQNNDKYGTITKQVFISLLQNSETEDVAPVIHAHWIYCESDDSWECSHCKMHSFQFVLFVRDGYCPVCGAKMDEEVSDNA